MLGWEHWWQAAVAFVAAFAPERAVCGRIASVTDRTVGTAATRESASGSTNPVTTPYRAETCVGASSSRVPSWQATTAAIDPKTSPLSSRPKTSRIQSISANESKRVLMGTPRITLAIR